MKNTIKDWKLAGNLSTADAKLMVDLYDADDKHYGISISEWYWDRFFNDTPDERAKRKHNEVSYSDYYVCANTEEIANYKAEQAKQERSLTLQKIASFNTTFKFIDSEKKEYNKVEYQPIMKLEAWHLGKFVLSNIDVIVLKETQKTVKVKLVNTNAGYNQQFVIKSKRGVKTFKIGHYKDNIFNLTLDQMDALTNCKYTLLKKLEMILA